MDLFLIIKIMTPQQKLSKRAELTNDWARGKDVKFPDELEWTQELYFVNCNGKIFIKNGYEKFMKGIFLSIKEDEEKKILLEKYFGN